MAAGPSPSMALTSLLNFMKIYTEYRLFKMGEPYWFRSENEAREIWEAWHPGGTSTSECPPIEPKPVRAKRLPEVTRLMLHGDHRVIDPKLPAYRAFGVDQAAFEEVISSPEKFDYLNVTTGPLNREKFAVAGYSIQPDGKKIWWSSWFYTFHQAATPRSTPTGWRICPVIVWDCRRRKQDETLDLIEDAEDAFFNEKTS